ncbi:MAG: hypothetical protein P8R43_06735 [Planctomycetota bacterium]|nr:hypothetical protein [Planctomycetota bacterium]
MTPRPEQNFGDTREPGRELDELLGVDPDPRLNEEARQRIHDQLSAENDRVLDAVLELDEVTLPGGLEGRVRAAVRADMRRRRLRPVRWTAAAAAAGLLVAAGAGWLPLGADGLSAVPFDGRQVASLESPSEELLAALPLLESLEFLEQEFDSFEREIALVVDPRDAVFLELLELGG